MNCNPCNLTESELTCGGKFKQQTSRLSTIKPCRDVSRLQIPVSGKPRAAFLKDSIWESDTILPVYFMEGSDKQRRWVQHIITSLVAPLVNIQFRWSTDDPSIDRNTSKIRITFNPENGAYSYVGKECLNISPSLETMNLGWLDDETDFNAEETRGTGQVIVHEFLHALGMIHEHQNPKDSCLLWNKPIVYADMAKAPNRWDKATTDVNVLDRYTQDQLNGSSYDPLSIMHYPFPAKFLCNPCNLQTGINPYMSKLDKEWLKKMYPRADDMDSGSGIITAINPFSGSKSWSKTQIAIISVLSVLVLLLIVFIIYKYYVKARISK